MKHINCFASRVFAEKLNHKGQKKVKSAALRCTELASTTILMVCRSVKTYACQCYPWPLKGKFNANAVYNRYVGLPLEQKRVLKVLHCDVHRFCCL